MEKRPADAIHEILAPLRHAVYLPLSPVRAFDVFTAEITRWWPLVTHSVWGGQAVSVHFEPGVGGRLLETRADGEQCQWARVTEWAPGQRLAMLWHPGKPPETSQEVVVTFREMDGGTLVELEHRGWNDTAQSAELRERYDGGWRGVLQRLAESLGTERENFRNGEGP